MHTFVFSASFGTSPFLMCQSLGFLGFLGRLANTLRAFFTREELGPALLLSGERLRLLPDEVPSPNPESESAGGCMWASELAIGMVVVKNQGIQSSQNMCTAHGTKHVENKGIQRDHVVEACQKI